MKKKSRMEWVTLPDGKRVYAETRDVDEGIQREFNRTISQKKKKGTER